MLTYIAIDQYGQTERLFSNHPRKELLEKLGFKNAQKMYVDSKEGNAYHVGYVINHRWFTIFKTEEMRIK